MYELRSGTYSQKLALTVDNMRNIYVDRAIAMAHGVLIPGPAFESSYDLWPVGRSCMVGDKLFARSVELGAS
jgi:hypothetical protein